jgi:hypothetical protein
MGEHPLHRDGGNLTSLLSPEDRAELLRRLRRIEGQVRGVENMLSHPAKILKRILAGTPTRRKLHMLP